MCEFGERAGACDVKRGKDTVFPAIICIFVFKTSIEMDDRRFVVTAEELRVECMRRKYCELLAQPEVFPSLDNWNYIIEKRMIGLGRRLYRKFLVSWLLDESKRCDYHRFALNKFPEYLRCVDRAYAVEVVYSDAVSSEEAFKKLVYDCELFDCDQVAKLIDDGHLQVAAGLLDAFQPEYDGDTLDAMHYLVSKFNSLPDIGTMDFRKGIFRSEQKYICPDGHVNNSDAMYCKAEGCGKDIKGMTESGRMAVERFISRIDILEEMLS